MFSYNFISICKENIPMGLVIGVIRVGVIGVLLFLNRSHLIESYHILRKKIFPKKMVKRVYRGVLRNITKTELRKFDLLVNLSEKCINSGVQINLQPTATVSSSIDKEEFQKMMEINLKLENRLTELEEMIRRADEKRKSGDLQDVTAKVDKLSNYQQSLTGKIEGELMTIGSDVETIKNYYGVLSTIFHELENKFISLEKNMAKPIRKYDTIKTRIRTLERDVMKNTSHVIGMDHANRSMESWTRLQYFGSAGMFPPADNRCYGEPAAFDAASSFCDMPPVPRTPAQYFLPPMTQFGPSASPSTPPAPNAFSRPPPPILPEPSAFLPKPPPVTLKKPGLKVTGSDESASSSSAITPKVYNQIPITTAMLKSVVLKPPDERKRVSKSAAI